MGLHGLLQRKLFNTALKFLYKANYFIQNLILHYFTEKKRECVTERERERERERRGHFFDVSGIRHKILYK
jgi:hypothetical protein